MRESDLGQLTGFFPLSRTAVEKIRRGYSAEEKALRDSYVYRCDLYRGPLFLLFNYQSLSTNVFHHEDFIEGGRLFTEAFCNEAQIRGVEPPELDKHALARYILNIQYSDEKEKKKIEEFVRKEFFEVRVPHSYDADRERAWKELQKFTAEEISFDLHKRASEFPEIEIAFFEFLQEKFPHVGESTNDYFLKSMVNGASCMKVLFLSSERATSGTTRQEEQ